jgi:hypothetical protein
MATGIGHERLAPAANARGPRHLRVVIDVELKDDAATATLGPNDSLHGVAARLERPKVHLDVGGLRPLPPLAVRVGGRAFGLQAGFLLRPFFEAPHGSTATEGCGVLAGAHPQAIPGSIPPVYPSTPPSARTRITSVGMCHSLCASEGFQIARSA